MTDSRKLLEDYLENRSESAFRELVSRYLDLVYSSAVRLVNGDAHLAEDIAQTVFMDLARQARALSKDVMLGGWLHRHTCFVAAKAMRSNRRRQFRERQAVEMNAQQDHSAENLAQVAPILDEAINRLGAQDRAAILLRFFEQRDLRSVGEALGSSENAAQKRLTRALERLRTLLTRRGVTLSAAGLATALAGEAVTAAPVGLAASISGAALAGAAASGGTTLTFLKLMTMTKLKITAASALVAAAVAVPVLQQTRLNRLATEKTELLRLTDRLAELQKENEQLSRVKVDSDELERLRLERGELYRLRGEVSLLRHRLQDLQMSDQRNGQLSKQTASDTRRAGDTQDANSIKPGFYPADSWEDEGLRSPQNSTLTFFWALRNGHAKQYSESLGKTNILQLPLPWANALGRVKGSQISETMTSVDGQPMVGILHELDDGTSANTWLSFRQVGDEWRVRELTGYPIEVFQVGTTTAP